MRRENETITQREIIGITGRASARRRRGGNPSCRLHSGLVHVARARRASGPNACRRAGGVHFALTPLPCSREGAGSITLLPITVRHPARPVRPALARTRCTRRAHTRDGTGRWDDHAAWDFESWSRFARRRRNIRFARFRSGVNVNGARGPTRVGARERARAQTDSSRSAEHGETGR